MGLLVALLSIGIFCIYIIFDFIIGVYYKNSEEKIKIEKNKRQEFFKNNCQDYNSREIKSEYNNNADFRKDLIDNAEKVLCSIDKNGVLLTDEAINTLAILIYLAEIGKVPVSVDQNSDYAILHRNIRDYTKLGDYPRRKPICSDVYSTNIFLKWYSEQIQRMYPDIYICRYNYRKNGKLISNKYIYLWNVFGDYKYYVCNGKPISSLSDEELAESSNLSYY